MLQSGPFGASDTQSECEPQTQTEETGLTSDDYVSLYVSLLLAYHSARVDGRNVQKTMQKVCLAALDRVDDDCKPQLLSMIRNRHRIGLAMEELEKELRRQKVID